MQNISHCFFAFRNPQLLEAPKRCTSLTQNNLRWYQTTEGRRGEMRRSEFMYKFDGREMFPNTCSARCVSALHTALHAHRYSVGTGALGDAVQYRHCGEACSNNVPSRVRIDSKMKEEEDDDDANLHALARFLATPEPSGRSRSTTRVIFSTVQ